MRAEGKSAEAIVARKAGNAAGAKGGRTKEQKLEERLSASPKGGPESRAERSSPVGATRQGSRSEAEAVEPRRAATGGPEGRARRDSRQKAMHEDLMEQVAAEENLRRALKAVKRNRGAAGIDGMTTEQLEPHFARHGGKIRAKLLAGRWTPSPVRRVEIPKPNGGKRLLGIPTVMDRLVQQALLQVLQPLFEPLFSESSYGFRPGRSAHDAVRAAQEYIREGRDWVVDIDIAKFFDHVHHDILMRRIAEVMRDKRVLRLIGRYLRAGVLVNGVVVVGEEGTPQGGPLSPLLANIYLDALDRELESRGLRFCRYADDCNIYVGSEAAAKRVLAGIGNWNETKLRLEGEQDEERGGAALGAQVSGVSHQPAQAAGSVEGKYRAVQEEGAGDLARRPRGHESAIAGRVAAVRDRLVGVLPTGREPASNLRTGRLDQTAHPEMLLAALAQCAGSLPRFAALGRARVDAALCADATRRLVRRGAADDAHGLVEAYLVALWVCDAVGSRGRKVKPPGSTAGYGKPYVRWCGRVPGRNPRHSTRSLGAPAIRPYGLFG